MTEKDAFFANLDAWHAGHNDAVRSKPPAPPWPAFAEAYAEGYVAGAARLRDDGVAQRVPAERYGSEGAE